MKTLSSLSPPILPQATIAPLSPSSLYQSFSNPTVKNSSSSGRSRSGGNVGAAASPHKSHLSPLAKGGQGSKGGGGGTLSPHRHTHPAAAAPPPPKPSPPPTVSWAADLVGGGGSSVGKDDGKRVERMRFAGLGRGSGAC
jgi:hypothetical protein